MPDKIKIAILDDHQIVIDGIKLLLSAHPNFHVVVSSTDADEIFRQMEIASIDILLTDIMMPEINGYEVAKIVRARFPNIKIIALTMSTIGDTIHKMVEELQIEGYLLKTCTEEQLSTAILSIHDGGKYYENQIWNELDRYNEEVKIKEEINFTPREIEIIVCIAKDLPNKLIADSLNISERTVETHRKNIFRKSNTHTAVALLEFARLHQYIT